MEKNELNIGVSILNWNAAAETIGCVKSVLASTYKNVSIYVLDNGSERDETPLLRKALNDTRVSIERSLHNLGFARGHNKIITHFLEQHYPYILLLNQDARLQPNALAELVHTLTTQPRWAAVGPLVLNPNGTVQSMGADIHFFTGKLTSRNFGRPLTLITEWDPHAVPVVVGNCIVMRSEAIRDIGGFDEKFFAYYEEVDWCWRAHKHGWKCGVNPAARVEHKKSAEFRTYLIVRNMVWFMRKHAAGWQKIIFFGYFWGWFIWERLKKGSPAKEIWRGARDGWLNKNQGVWPK